MAKWISIAAVTMVTAVAACTASQDSFKVQPVLSFDGKPVKDSAAAEYKKGKQLLKQGRFALAAQAFQAALFVEGSSVRLLNALAVSYDKLGRYDLSDRYYQRALALNPNNPQTTNNLAVSLAQRGAPDLAAKVLAEAHAQRPSDKLIADNLELAQRQVIPRSAAVTMAPLPVPSVSPVPRIEQTSPSTQQLLTVNTPAGAAERRPALTPRVVSGAPNVGPEKVDEKSLRIAGASAGRPETVSGAPVDAQKLAIVLLSHADPSPPVRSSQKAPSVSAPRSQGLPQQVQTPVVVSGATGLALANARVDQAAAVNAAAEAPAVISPTGAPASRSGTSESAETNKTAPVAQLQAAGRSTTEGGTTAASVQPGTKTPNVQGAPGLDGVSVTALARSRLGSRIAESDNIQPIDGATQEAIAPKLALQRLGVPVEVANGAGRRYMAARMRTFLDGHGFDVAQITNARSFEHVQTVIVYRDQFQPEALDLAKSLATKVELVHVADLPVDVRLILGRDLLPFDRTLEKGG